MILCHFAFRMSEFPRKLTLALLFAVLGLCIYRARTQSFTVDEAWVFQLYVDKPLIEMARVFDAANHVLHTALMKLARASMGTGEFALRLPTLIAAAFYFAAVYRLTLLLFRGWMQPLAAATLVLHPLVLDFFVAARGYGLALALFAWSFWFAVCYFVKGFDRSRLSLAGILAGLAIGANLTLLVPAVALGLMLIVLLWREDGPRAVWSAVDSYGGPAVVIPALALIFPLLAAEGHEFYFGVQSMSVMTGSLTEFLPVPARLALSAAFWILAIAGGLMAVRYARAARADFRRTPFALAAGTLGLTVLLLFAGHHAAGIPYPLHRTALYLVPLFTLSGLLGLQFVRLRAVAPVLCVLLSALYLSALETRYFRIWRSDASTATLMTELNNAYSVSSLNRPARLAASGVLTRTVAYYKMRRRMDWLSVQDASETDADYYLLTGRDRGLVSALSLQVVDDDALSGTVLARRSP